MDEQQRQILHDEITRLLDECRICERNECPEWCMEFCEQEVRTLVNKF